MIRLGFRLRRFYMEQCVLLILVDVFYLIILLIVMQIVVDVAKYVDLILIYMTKI